MQGSIVTGTLPVQRPPAIHRGHLPRIATGLNPAMESPPLRARARALHATGLPHFARRAAADWAVPHSTGRGRFAAAARVRLTPSPPPMQVFPPRPGDRPCVPILGAPPTVFPDRRRASLPPEPESLLVPGCAPGPPTTASSASH